MQRSGEPVDSNNAKETVGIPAVPKTVVTIKTSQKRVRERYQHFRYDDHQQEVMRNIGLDSVQDGQPDTGAAESKWRFPVHVDGRSQKQQT
jgi:hypothetical protein